MLWVTDHLADLRSDFSRYHRIDDIEQMDSVRFFEMAYRITAYGGVMTTRRTQRAAPATVADVGPQAPPSPIPGKMVESTPAALINSDISDMFSFGKA